MNTTQRAEYLAHTYADAILRLSYTYLKNTQDAQDICQTVLLKLLTNPRRFTEERLERAWVIRVTINCCKDLKKSAWHRRHVPLEEACCRAAVFVPPEGESPVLQAVQSLPVKYRQAIYLRYYEEYTVEEIAGVMGCRPSQVSTYLYRGKAKLRTALGGSYERACLSE